MFKITPRKKSNKKKNNPKKENTTVTETNPYAKYNYGRRSISDFKVTKNKHE